MSTRVVTVKEVLDGHVVLDIECLDRIYLNAYVPILQSSGQVVAFMTRYLDMPDSLADATGEERRQVPRGGDLLRGGQSHPGGPVQEGGPQG